MESGVTQRIFVQSYPFSNTVPPLAPTHKLLSADDYNEIIVTRRWCVRTRGLCLGKDARMFLGEQSSPLPGNKPMTAAILNTKCVSTMINKNTRLFGNYPGEQNLAVWPTETGRRKTTTISVRLGQIRFAHTFNGSQQKQLRRLNPQRCGAARTIWTTNTNKLFFVKYLLLNVL